MKKSALTFALLTTLTIVVFGQEPLTYTEVVQVDSASKTELYNRTKLWFATAYNSANDVIQMSNQESGER